MTARKLLIVGGLFFLTLSMVYGSIFSLFLDRFSEERKSALQNGFQDRLPEANDAVRYEETFRTAGQHRSSHSHLSLFGLIALAVGVGIQYINLSELWLKLTAATFLFGGFLLPLGVFLEPMYNKKIGSLLALVGGLMVILAMAIFFFGAYRYKADGDN